MSPPWVFHFHSFFLSCHCHCHYCAMCDFDFWKGLFRKCLLNYRKVQANIRKYLLCVLLKVASVFCETVWTWSGSKFWLVSLWVNACLWFDQRCVTITQSPTSESMRRKIRRIQHLRARGVSPTVLDNLISHPSFPPGSISTTATRYQRIEHHIKHSPPLSSALSLLQRCSHTRSPGRRWKTCVLRCRNDKTVLHSFSLRLCLWEQLNLSLRFYSGLKNRETVCGECGWLEGPTAGEFGCASPDWCVCVRVGGMR